MFADKTNTHVNGMPAWAEGFVIVFTHHENKLDVAIAAVKNFPSSLI